MLRPIPSYGVYCYARYQVTVFIVTPGTKLRCLLLRPDTKLRCLLLRPVPSYGVYCYARYQAVKLLEAICSLSLSLEYIIYKISLRTALRETIILKLRSNSITSLYAHQYCAGTSNFKLYSRKTVSFYEFMDVPRTVF